MAQYGVNFGRPSIPESWKVKREIKPEGWNLPRGHYARLVGSCTTEDEKDQMIFIATNGRRRLYVAERKQANQTVYLIYAY